MAEEVVATFSGPLDSFSINLTIDNASNSDVREFGISGRTAKFPVTWDSFGSLAGPVTATATDGVDTEVVMVHLSNFGPGVQASFNGIDPDFTGDSSSGVRVLIWRAPEPLCCSRTAPRGSASSSPLTTGRSGRSSPSSESGTIWGRLRCERHGIRSLVEAGVPAAEVAGELVVEDAGADLQQQVGATSIATLRCQDASNRWDQICQRPHNQAGAA